MNSFKTAGFGIIGYDEFCVPTESLVNIRPSTVLDQNRDLIRRVVLSHRSSNPRVFGSVIRGTDTETSDLDLLVDPLPGVTLFDLGAIQMELEATLGVSVDVLTPKGLPLKFRDQILTEAVPV